MTLNILHLHSSFDAGGKELRAVRLMNAFGKAARHTIVSGVPGALGARAAIEPGIDAAIRDDWPLTGPVSVARYHALAERMRRFDLILSYSWGAIDGVMARRMFARDLPPLVHHEDGFNEDEASGLKRERNWLRRLALPAAHALVVPSHTLEKLALDVWKQPRDRVRRISNGIVVERYTGTREVNAVPGFTKDKDEIVVGTIAGLRAVKNLPRLVTAFAAVSAPSRLVIVGDGPSRPAILAEAARLGVADRVHLPGFLPDPHRYIGLFDIFALSSHSEQQPIAVMEAMAAGLPVAAPDVGDIRCMVAPENRALIGPDLARALATLADDPALRARLGEANRARAAAEFGERSMIVRYAALYEEAISRPGALGSEAPFGAQS